MSTTSRRAILAAAPKFGDSLPAFANQEALTDTLYRMLGLADAIFAIVESGAAERYADSAMLGVQEAIRRDVSDLLEAAQAHEIVVNPEARS